MGGDTGIAGHVPVRCPYCEALMDHDAIEGHIAAWHPEPTRNPDQAHFLVFVALILTFLILLAGTVLMAYQRWALRR